MDRSLLILLSGTLSFLVQDADGRERKANVAQGPTLLAAVSANAYPSYLEMRQPVPHRVRTAVRVQDEM